MQTTDLKEVVSLRAIRKTLHNNTLRVAEHGE